MQLAKLGLRALATTALIGAADAQIYISEICDGTLPGGQPKWVQITNCSGVDIPDLSIYSIQNINNGSMTTAFDAVALNPVALADGESYVWAYESASNTGCDPMGLVTCFEFVYGQPADQYSGSFINGDDVVSLYLGIAQGTSGGGPGDGSDAMLIDRYGEVGVDGTGTFWDYEDGYSRRCTTTGNPVFTQAEWFFGGANSVEDPGGDDMVELMLLQTLTTPLVKDGCPGAAPVTYCTPKLSSAGCTNVIATSSPSTAPVSGANDYAVTASNVQGFKNGLLFGGINGPAAIPFGGGTLCVSPPTKRGPLVNSGGSSTVSCDGTYSTTINDGNVIPVGLDAGAGNTAWYQYWYRDPANGAGVFGTALSNAVEVAFN